MSSPRVTVRTSQLNSFLKTLGLFLVCVVGLSGCPQLLCDSWFGIGDQCETYFVTYAPNGADSGLAPVDGREYQDGDTVTVSDNVGGLSRSGFSFNGWNTAPNGNGVLYIVGQTFRIAAADVTLYAEWSEDEEDAGITVDPTSGLVTTESGGSATFTIVLNTQPTADVTLNVSSDNTSEGTVNPNSLTFTENNWSNAQTVTVTGVDDDAADGNQTYMIVTAVASSEDQEYSGLNADDVSITNSDNDSAGITVNPTSGLVTTEAGGNATFTVVLNTAPHADVTIGLSSSDTGEGTVSPNSLTFTSGNWSNAQTVTVTGVDDAIADGNQSYTIVTAAAVSGDENYSGLNADDVSITNSDNDTAGITVNPTSGLVTTEAGGNATFMVVLNTQPVADVTIGLSSSDTGEGTVSPNSLTFTSSNWSNAQTVTVTGVDDAIDDGNQSYTIVTATATNYSGLNASDVSVTNNDNDYTVTYNANSVASGSVPTGPTAYQQGATVTVLNNTGNLARTGYSFIGWNTKADGNGTSYEGSDTFEMGSANVTLYAVWSQNPIGDEQEFTYTGGVQTFTVPSGVNEIEIQAWGAQGGSGGCYDNCAGLNSIGGRGGYSEGVLSVSPGATVYVYVGGEGEGYASPVTQIQGTDTRDGGWNGGGDSYTQWGGAGGGGASDVRYGGTAISERKIVAGGGGGGGNAQNDSIRSHGGAGGGLSGQTMDKATQFYGRTPGEGATQNSGNSNGVGSSGSQNLAGGGGGGYYGGGAGANSTGGGGGSGYIGGVSNGETIAGNLSMPNPDGGTMTGREGNGLIIISY